MSDNYKESATLPLNINTFSSKPNLPCLFVSRYKETQKSCRANIRCANSLLPSISANSYCLVKRLPITASQPLSNSLLWRMYHDVSHFVRLRILHPAVAEACQVPGWALAGKDFFSFFFHRVEKRKGIKQDENVLISQRHSHETILNILKI